MGLFSSLNREPKEDPCHLQSGTFLEYFDLMLYVHMPIPHRFTFGNLLYALARGWVYIVTSFGLVYLGNYFGHFGLGFITLPMMFAYFYAFLHFEGLERQWGMFHPNNSYFKTVLLKKG